MHSISWLLRHLTHELQFVIIISIPFWPREMMQKNRMVAQHYFRPGTRL